MTSSLKSLHITERFVRANFKTENFTSFNDANKHTSPVRGAKAVTVEARKVRMIAHFMVDYCSRC